MTEHEKSLEEIKQEWEEKKNDLWQITLTREQLSLMANFIEDCARFSCGQTEMWHTTSNLGLGTEDYLNLKGLLENAHMFVTPEFAGSPGASYGWSGHSCPRESQKKMIAQGYMMYREILHQIAKDEGWDNVYSSPTLTCPEQGRMIEVKKLPKTNADS